MRYRRADAAGGTYFFTVNLAERSSDKRVRYVEEQRAVMKGKRGASLYDTGNGGVTRTAASGMALTAG